MTALLEARGVTKIFTSGLIQKHQTVALEDFSLRPLSRVEVALRLNASCVSCDRNTFASATMPTVTG